MSGFETTRLGVIEFYNEKKGFGFAVLTNADGTKTKFFVHHSQILNEVVPTTGSMVRFQVGQIPTGRSLALAEKVVIIKPWPLPTVKTTVTPSGSTSGAV